jgi:hypothetical protein
MKAILGIIVIVGGIALGIYLGLWVCFVGGIIGFIDAVKANPVDAYGVAWSIVRVLFAGFVGWGTAAISIGIGSLIKG